MYKCKSCGGGLIYDPKSEKLLCLYCRQTIEPEDAKYYRFAQDKTIEEADENGKTYTAVVHKCTQCGAELLSTDETISTFCSYCRSSATIESKVVEENKPDYIIPFKIPKEECQKAYVNLITKSIFAPKDMIDTQNVEKIRGIYMPYDIYSYEKKGTIYNKGHKYSHRSGDYIIYDDYEITSEIDTEIEGISHDSSKDFFDNLSEAIAPFDFNQAKDFSAAYLSGYYADSESIKNNQIYINKGKDIAEKFAVSKLDKRRIRKIWMFFSNSRTRT